MLNLKVEGAGPDLVLLHGWGMRLQVWDDIILALRRHYRVIRVDLPGHGESRQAPALSARALAEGLEGRLTAPARWVGWSLGGLLALQLAEIRPDWFERLCLVACNPCFVSSGDWPGVDAQTFAGFAAGLEQDPPQTWKRFMALIAQGGNQRDVLRRLRQSAGAQMPESSSLHQGLELLARTDLRSSLDTRPFRVRWLLGTADALVPAAVGDRLNAFTSIRSADVIPGAGHVPFLSHPETFTERLDNVMSSV